MADENDTQNIEDVQGEEGDAFESAFSEFAGEGNAEENGEVEEKNKVVENTETSTEKENGREEEEEQKTSTKESTLEILTKRAADFTGTQNQQTEDQKPIEQQKPQEEKKEVKETQSSTEFNFENFDKLIPDGEVEVGGRKINPKEYMKDFPDEASFTMLLIQNAMKALKIPQGPAEIRDERFDEFSKNFAEFKEQYNHERFMAGVERRHSDVMEIVNSEEFKEWVGKQSPGIQKLANESNDVEDADYILKAFKEEKDKRSGGENKLKSLYKNNLKGQGGGKPKVIAKSGNPDEEFGEAFNEFASGNK